MVKFVYEAVYLFNIIVFSNFLVTHGQRLTGKNVFGDQTTSRKERKDKFIVCLHVWKQAKGFRSTHPRAEPTAPEQLTQHPHVSLNSRLRFSRRHRLLLNNAEHGPYRVRNLILHEKKVSQILFYHFDHIVRGILLFFTFLHVAIRSRNLPVADPELYLLGWV